MKENCTKKKTVMSHDNIGDMFLNYELWRTNSLSTKKNVKLSGKLLYENGDEQEIFYSIKTDSSLVYQGNITYNKKDKAITHFEFDFTQSKSKPQTVKDENGNEFKRQPGDGIITFDYYKKDGKYFPSKITVKSKGFKVYTDTQSYEYAYSREMIFKSATETDKKGLENPVKINEAYWNNLKLSDNKGDILLTKEEQDFVNEKNN